MQNNNAAADKNLSEAASGLKTKLRALKCPNCGGSLTLKGGHSVKTVVCQYCGSILDAKDDWRCKAAGKLAKVDYPLKIGMEGTIRGVKFVIIGIAAYEQKEEGKTYTWVEYFLFSYTHGYAYLDCENGHWSLIHEVKDLPDNDQASVFTVRDKSFRVFERGGEAKVSYAVGEFTWEIAKGDRVRFTDAVCPPYVFSIEWHAKEREYFWGEYIYPKEIKKGFGVSELPKRRWLGACQPLWCEELCRDLAVSSAGVFVFTVICLLCCCMTPLGEGTCILKGTFSKEEMSEGVVTQEFSAKKGVPYGITLNAGGLNNSWYYAAGKLIDKNEEFQYAEFASEMSRYSGCDDEGSWTEDYSEQTCYIEVPEDGVYKIAVKGEGGLDQAQGGDYPFKNLSIAVSEDPRLSDYTAIWVTILLFLCVASCLGLGVFGIIRGGETDDEYDDD